MSNSVPFIFRAIDRFTSVGSRIAASQNSINRAVERGNKILRQNAVQSTHTSAAVTKGFKHMAGAVAAYVSITSTLNTGATFQDSVAELSSITGAAGKDLDFLSNSARKMAIEFGTAQNVVVKSITDIASAKSELLKDPEALITITKQALLLARAAGITVPDAVQASVGALNQFNKGADDAGRFVNVLAAGSKVGAAQVSSIVESLKNAGSVASAFNVSFEDTNALLQVLAKNGIKGAEAGTALRGTLSKLEKVANGALAPSKIGILKSLELLESAGLTNVQVIKEFGEENLRSVIILRKNIDLFKQWSTEITGTNVAQEQADKRSKTFNFRLEKMQTIIKDKLITVFLRLEPVLSKNVDRFGEWIDKIDPASIDTFVDAVSNIASGFAAVATVVGEVIGLVSGLGKVMGEVGGAFATWDFSQFSSLTGQTPSLSDWVAENRKSNSAGDKLGSSAGKNPAGLKADISMNISAPSNTVNDLKTKMPKSQSGLNIGVNMQES